MQPTCTIEVCPASPKPEEHQRNGNTANSNDINAAVNLLQPSTANRNNFPEPRNPAVGSVDPYTEIRLSNSSFSVSSNQRQKSSRIRSNSKNGTTSTALLKSTKLPTWRTHKYGKYCWKSWITFVHLVIAFRAIIVRIGFICFTCTAIVTVVKEKQDARFWFLALTIIPLLIDLIIAIKSYISGRSVAPIISKWFSLCNFTYLLCACPPIWIIELHHMDQVNNASAIFELISTKNHTPLYTPPVWINKISMISPENESMMIMGEGIEEYIHSVYLTTTTREPHGTKRIVRDTSIHEPVYHFLDFEYQLINLQG
ncbi:unnamed protein product [Heterobilharzia americana]|nr:unnamed protein product [Heterobilharzia americana]